VKKQRAQKALEKMGYSNQPALDWKNMSAENFHYSVFYLEDPRLLRKRYTPVIAGWMLAGGFSIALTGLLVLVTYLSGAPDDTTLRNWFFSWLAITVVFGIAKARVLYGHIHWIWIHVGVYSICFMVSLASIIYAPNIYLYSTALLCPLIGLLILNSHRCRELRHKMVELRHKREAIIATLKKQGRWKWW